MSADKTPGEKGAEESPLFSAVITPHRSLGPRGFRVLMVLLCVAAGLLGLRFLALGFWPVTGFLGLDILALYVALRISYRRAAGFEELRLTPIELLFRRVTHRGETREWRLNPLWTRLERQSHEDFGLQRLALVSGRQHIVIARELSPDERESFADALSDALSRARRGF